MTYILGARCKDGVVLVADTKFTVDYGEHFVYGEKLFGDATNSFVLGFSGDRGAFELFKTTFDDAVNEYYKLNEKMPIDKLILLTSDTISKVNNKFRYDERFDAILGVSNGRENAILKYFYPDGRLESVDTVRTIGSGTPYGSIFLRKWHSDMTMAQTAELGYFIIRYVERFQLTHSVGIASGEPSIWFLPDPAFKDRKGFTPELLEPLDDITTMRLAQFSSTLDGMFNGFVVDEKSNLASKK